MSRLIPPSGFTRHYNDVATCLDTPVGIGLPFDLLGGEEQPPLPSDFSALWDTGATKSCIRYAIAKQLNLPQIGETEVLGVDGLCISDIYLASVGLPNHVAIPEIELLGCNDSLDYSMLIGMDIINKGDFLINTFNGRTTFSFQMPAIQPLDLKHLYFKPVKIGRNSPCPCGSGQKYKNCCGKAK